VFDENPLTRADFVKAFDQVIAFIKKIELKNLEDIRRLDRTLTGVVNKLKDDATNDIGELKKQVNSLIAEKINKLTSEYERKMEAVDDRLMEIKDGKDADEIVIAEKASKMAQDGFLASMPSILPKLGLLIRDGLELLQGGERLEISAIKDLREELDRLKEERRLGGGGGGFSKIAMDIHFIDDEVPTGDINGANTDYVLAHNPNPTASLKVYLDGQKMKLTTDYTLSGKTITFLAAPLTGSNIVCDYRK
jgi:hypothetical protein